MTETDSEMKVDPARAAHLVAQLRGVQERIAAVASGKNVRLVAVSKLKPASDILALHQTLPTTAPSQSKSQSPSPLQPHVHFGENYAQELTQKAALLPRSIAWHFIGALQSGHCKSLARVPNLWGVSSVCSTKHASLLDKARGELIASSSTSSSSAGAVAGRERKQDGQKQESATTEQQSQVDNADAPPPRLNVHVQVNTSGESSKSGCQPGADTVALCRFVREECPHLKLLGLMTIGAIARSVAAGSGSGDENEDFATLVREKDNVVGELGLSGDEATAFELSMGMSEDFETAIRMGSSEVRVGSTIFGTRPPKHEAKVI